MYIALIKYVTQNDFKKWQQRYLHLYDIKFLISRVVAIVGVFIDMVCKKYAEIIDTFKTKSNQHCKKIIIIMLYQL